MSIQGLASTGSMARWPDNRDAAAPNGFQNEDGGRRVHAIAGVARLAKCLRCAELSMLGDASLSPAGLKSRENPSGQRDHYSDRDWGAPGGSWVSPQVLGT